MIPTAHVVLSFLFFLNLFSRASSQDTCQNLLQRKEWRNLLDEEKKCYIDAVNCLRSLPAHNTSRPASWTRFDEFQALHVELTPVIHFVGQFLPWHRYFLELYESALRNECGYKGAQPYWNWSIDADSGNPISESPIWDPATGFGGDGVPGTYVVPADPTGTSLITPSTFRGCVQDGPFANYTLKLGPGLLGTNHCLTRGFNDTFKAYLTSSAVALTLTFTTYEEFSVQLEGWITNVTTFRIHNAGHLLVGGEMANLFSSTGDPIFYTHHANLDRIWWEWQQSNSSHFNAMGGSSTTSAPFLYPNYTAPSVNVNVTTSFPLEMGDIGPTIPISEVMDIHNQRNCYTYV